MMFFFSLALQQRMICFLATSSNKIASLVLKNVASNKSFWHVELWPSFGFCERVQLVMSAVTSGSLGSVFLKPFCPQESESSQSQSDNPFKLSKWEVMDDQLKMGESYFFTLKLFLNLFLLSASFRETAFPSTLEMSQKKDNDKAISF